MADSSTKRRWLFMHPAHRAVGVMGDGMAPGPYCRIDGLSSTDGSGVGPMCVALLAYRLDTDAQAAMTLFEQATAGRCDLECGRVEIESVDAGWEGVSDADGLVVFGRPLYVARHWRDVDHVALAAGGPPNGDSRPMEVEIAAAAEWHPVLDGVWPFLSCHDPAEGIGMPDDAIVLLTGRAAGETRPVGWVRDGHQGRVFGTSLGCCDDFRQPDFVRLVLNALTWVSQ